MGKKKARVEDHVFGKGCRGGLRIKGRRRPTSGKKVPKTLGVFRKRIGNSRRGRPRRTGNRRKKTEKNVKGKKTKTKTPERTGVPLPRKNSTRGEKRLLVRQGGVSKKKSTGCGENEHLLRLFPPRLEGGKIKEFVSKRRSSLTE